MQFGKGNVVLFIVSFLSFVRSISLGETTSTYNPLAMLFIINSIRYYKNIINNNGVRFQRMELLICGSCYSYHKLKNQYNLIYHINMYWLWNIKMFVIINIIQYSKLFLGLIISMFVLKLEEKKIIIKENIAVIGRSNNHLLFIDNHPKNISVYDLNKY
ncbi:hypothetical protein RFI_01899 [Reticulomyxa filosa]|uniref:Uncharacterized protein n=1 Tax=Reticulomyxa filosa TaxID=46433 RepID=X6PAT0_RETFI|nr:hypothetical protein RFI_01899 [Reticulomyxa filosa]|eukprot:ETO35174.1 hypothetical protein RFI_01899 [Reticulomyxa filosa]